MSKKNKRSIHVYCEEEIAYLREISPGRSNKEITRMFNEKFNLNLGEKAIATTRKRYGIKTGNDGRFKKGNVPWNKGKKGVNIGGKETQFKKGHIPANHRPVGSERITIDGYIEIKVAEPNKWRPKHQVIWEKHNGPIPDGHVVIFGDGNKQNLSIDNLILVSRKQLLGLNRYNLIQNHADLTKIATRIVDLKYKISERENQVRRN